MQQVCLAASLAALIVTTATPARGQGLSEGPALPAQVTHLTGRLIKDARYWPNWQLIGPQGQRAWIHPSPGVEAVFDRLPTHIQVLPGSGDSLEVLAARYHVAPDALRNYNQPLGAAVAIPGCWVELDGERVGDAQLLAREVTNLSPVHDFQAREGEQPGLGRWLQRAGFMQPLPMSGPESITRTGPGLWRTYRGRMLRGPDGKAFHMLIEAARGEVIEAVEPQAEPQRPGVLEGATRVLGGLFGGGGSQESAGGAAPGAREPGAQAGAQVWIVDVQGEFARLEDGGWVPLDTLRLDTR